MTTLAKQMAADHRASLAEEHARKHPDGCADFCEACYIRLKCKSGRHEWPRNYSDGDSCYCGKMTLSANDIDKRPIVCNVGRLRG